MSVIPHIVSLLCTASASHCSLAACCVLEPKERDPNSPVLACCHTPTHLRAIAHSLTRSHSHSHSLARCPSLTLTVPPSYDRPSNLAFPISLLSHPIATFRSPTSLALLPVPLPALLPAPRFRSCAASSSTPATLPSSSTSSDGTASDATPGPRGASSSSSPPSSMPSSPSYSPSATFASPAPCARTFSCTNSGMSARRSPGSSAPSPI